MIINHVRTLPSYSLLITSDVAVRWLWRTEEREEQEKEGKYEEHPKAKETAGQADKRGEKPLSTKSDSQTSFI